MKRFTRILPLIVLGAGLLSACNSAPELGSDAWCEMMDAKSKNDWTLDDTGNYAKFCVLGVGTAVGSKQWCEQMAAKPKGDWSANAAADYAEHCIF
jgi:predicted small secreted protein